MTFELDDLLLFVAMSFLKESNFKSILINHIFTSVVRSGQVRSGQSVQRAHSEQAVVAHACQGKWGSE